MAESTVLSATTGDPGLALYGLRHTYVTHSYINHKNDADFDLETFSRSIGHKSARATMEIYTHLFPIAGKRIWQKESTGS